MEGTTGTKQGLGMSMLGGPLRPSQGEVYAGPGMVRQHGRSQGCYGGLPDWLGAFSALP